MNRFSRAAALPLFAVACFSAHATSQAQSVPSIRKVEVLRTRGQVEIEIEASDRIVPQINILKNPDRLVVDFVNAVPGTHLRHQAVNRAEVKNLRVGLFSADPPVTRLVLDLAGPQPYQVFPSGRTVILKVGAGGNSESAGYQPSSGLTLNGANYSAGAHLSVEIPPATRPALAVSFRDGMLTINANKANLSEVLFAVHQRTGADIAIPAGAEQEQVVAELGPAPAPEVLSHLLNGSKFNFLILSSSTDPKVLDRVILSSRPEGPMYSAAVPRAQPATVAADEDDDPDAEPRPAPAPTYPRRVTPAPGVTPPPVDTDVDHSSQPGDPPPPPRQPDGDSNN
jgi:hypothetical protein